MQASARSLSLSLQLRACAQCKTHIALQAASQQMKGGLLHAKKDTSLLRGEDGARASLNQIPKPLIPSTLQRVLSVCKFVFDLKEQRF